MNRKFNPATIAPPGRYNHGVAVPAGSRFCYSAGQVGRNPDGSLPEDFAAQVRNCYHNLGEVLAADGMTLEDLVKVTVFVTRHEHVARWREIRDRLLGETKPASTMLVVASLSEPGYLVEVEGVAAKLD
jgi:2-iminobutanoate/2-iminopropanoate deaminase